MREVVGCRLGLGVLLAAGLVVGGPDRVLAQEAEADWPAVIGRLRRQLDTPRVRGQLAIAYNNYAISLAGQGDYPEAIQQLEEAMSLDPEAAQYRTNLARIYVQVAQEAYQAHDLREARRLVNDALALDAEEVSAYHLLGQIEYNRQRLRQAKKAWEHALELDPTRADIQKRLELVSGELPVESKFERVSQAYFDIRFTGDLTRTTGFGIRDALVDARRTIGSDFKYWPRHKLVVIVYRAHEFRQLRTGTPEWLAGQYDGKIRVPLPGEGFDQDTVRRTLRHEYTHALVHDLTKDACPLWLNEGLAEYQGWKGQEPQWPRLRAALASDQLIPWDGLNSQFSMGAAPGAIRLAYEQCHSMVQYLAKRYGFWRIRRVLKELAAGQTFEDASAKEFHIKRARLEVNWRKWLEGLLAKSSS